MSIYIPYLSSIPFKSELYLSRYIKFIEACLEKNVDLSPDVYTEEHHILPKAKTMFPQFINLRQHPWNAARLTPRQHLIAHLMLKKAYMNAAMCRAVTKMAGKNERNSRWYEQARIDHGAAMRVLFTGKPRSDETKKKISNALKGRTVSEEHRKNISIGATGRTHSDETKMKMSISHQNMSDETKMKMSEAKQNMSDETKMKMSIANQGQNNYLFKGFYQTPFGTFDSSLAASKAIFGGISRGTLIAWCKRDNLRVISNRTFTKSKFLQDNYAREDIVGKKTFNDLGFYFITS